MNRKLQTALAALVCFCEFPGRRILELGAAGPEPVELHPGCHVVQDRHRRKRVGLLEDHADAAAQRDAIEAWYPEKALARVTPQAAGAQTYPARSVTIIVPSAAGGGNDTLSRILGDQLSKQLGQPFVVENRTGGGMLVGTTAAAKAAITDAQLTKVVQTNCASCHSDRLKEQFANLSLQGYDVAAAAKNADVSEKMIRKLRAGMMPPANAPKPPAEILVALVDRLESKIDVAAKLDPNPGNRSFQRLNRAEYKAAVKDLLGLDIDPAKVEAINRGESYIQHIDADLVKKLVGKGRLMASADFARIKEVEAVIICVPTPLNKNREPDISYIIKTGEVIAPHSYGDWHMIVVMDGSLEVAGRTLGPDGFLRIAPNNPVAEIRAGTKGGRLLEGARTSHGYARRPIG